MSNLRIVLYVFAAYEGIQAVAEIISNTATNSPTADTVSALPSAGSVFAGSDKGTQKTVDAVVAVVAFVAAQWLVD